MNQKENEYTPKLKDEVDMTLMALSLWSRKKFIVSFTALITSVAVLISLSNPTIHRSYSSFILPNETSMTLINMLYDTEETRDSVFRGFLNKLTSPIVQKEAFINGNYEAKFNKENMPIDDIDTFILNSLGEISVSPPSRTILDMELNLLNEKPYIAYLEGQFPIIMSNYLNELIVLADSKAIDQILEVSKLNINNRISVIQERATQLTMEINDEIRREKYKAQQFRLNEIFLLSESAQLAKNLDILENNFNQLNDSEISIAIGDGNVPNWYLYGAKALLEQVSNLQNRSVDHFNEEVVILENELDAVRNNNQLITLIKRQDFQLDLEKVNSMQLRSVAKSKVMPSALKWVLLLSVIFGFLFSIVVALIMNLFKPFQLEPI